MRVFENCIKSHVDLSQQAWHDLEMISKPSQVYKKDVLVNEGRAFNKEVFIVKGVVRAYTLDKEGNERTTAFYQARDFMNISTLRNQDGEEKIAEHIAGGVLNLLGIELEEIDGETAANIGARGGLRITDIKSGIFKRSTDARVGFIITKVDGKEIRTIDEFTSYLDNREGGVLLEGNYEDLPGKYYYAFGL